MRIYPLVFIMIFVIELILIPGPAASQTPSLQLGMHTIRASDNALRLTHEAGFSWIVQLLEWRAVAPTPDRRNWEYSDFLVQGCEYYQLNLALRLDHPPDWAQTTATELLPVDPELYRSFVEEVAQRYRGRVQAYIIWNEPNLSIEWNGKKPAAENYVTLLKTAYTAIKSVDPNAIVVSAGLASTNEQSEAAQDDRLYLKDMYGSGAKGYFDALGAHPYGFAYPPDDKSGAHESLNFARLEELRQIMIEHDDAETPVWATEVGWISEPAPQSKEWQQVTRRQQAQYLVEAVRIATNNWPWLRLLAVWTLSPMADQPDITGYSIVAEDYAPRLAYEALAGMNKPPQIQRTESPAPSESVQVIAPDVVVHLGDSLTVNPGWSPLYCESAPCRKWTGQFYVPDSISQRNDRETLLLRMEIMQVEEQGNLVRINGQSILPQAIPPRAKPDFVTAWIMADMTIPAGSLKTGYNTIDIMASPRLIPYQTGIRFESLQIKNIRIMAGDGFSPIL